MRTRLAAATSRSRIGITTCSTSTRPSSRRPGEPATQVGALHDPGRVDARGGQLEAGGGARVDRGVRREAGVEPEVGEDLHEQRRAGPPRSGDDHLARPGRRRCPRGRVPRSWPRCPRESGAGAPERPSTLADGVRGRFRTEAAEVGEERVGVARAAPTAPPAAARRFAAMRRVSAGRRTVSSSRRLAARVRPWPTGTRSSGRVRRCTGEAARSARKSATRDPAPEVEDAVARRSRRSRDGRRRRSSAAGASTGASRSRGSARGGCRCRRAGPTRGGNGGTPGCRRCRARS